MGSATRWPSRKPAAPTARQPETAFDAFRVPRLGATPSKRGVQFTVWAPRAHSVDVELSDTGRSVPMQHTADGVWSVHVVEAGAGTRYRYRVDGEGPFPDPYSRSQPEGVHGPSEVVDPHAFAWHDREWGGLSIEGLVIYQAHVGTATQLGTFDSLSEALPRLKSLGVSAVQLLPVAEFPGQRNWGYDGVDLFAPSHVFGGPEAFKRFVDSAHQLQLGVILDVVYNHLGPDGNYWRAYSASCFTDRYQTPWGEAINYDGPGCDWVRKLVLDNACYWLDEYHVDGLRLDATHAIFDRSQPHVLAELTSAARASVRADRQVVLIAESSENDVRYLEPVDEGGLGFDAVYADDFHHILRRYLAGDHEGYYARYAGTLDELARCIEQGWLYEGQPVRDSRTGERRGTPARDRPAWQFLYVIQNHDQVGNRAFGERLNHQIDLERFAAASMLLLYLPYTPMLFMGQEFVASTPFQFFTDHNSELGRLVTQGRREEFKAFSAFADASQRERIPDPQSESTFVASKLRLEEAEAPPGSEMQALHRALLHLRRTDPVLVDQNRQTMRARALSEDVLVVWRSRDAHERLLLLNFGAVEARVGSYGGGWRVLMDSGPPAELAGDHIAVAPRSATVLARDGR